MIYFLVLHRHRSHLGARADSTHQSAPPPGPQLAHARYRDIGSVGKPGEVNCGGAEVFQNPN